MFVFAAPAQANHTSPDSVSLFMPQDDYTDKDQLSDQFDGEDNAAHLTAVATSDTDSVTFFVCPTGQTPFLADGTSVRRNTGCAVAGTDTTGERPTELDVHGDATSDEAYEAFWNIPQTLDGEVRDVFAVACQGAEGTADSETANDVPDNCTQDGEADIYLEDASDEDDLISGEILAICTAEESDDRIDPGTGDPDLISESEAGANECFRGADGDYTADPAERTAFREDLAIHGGIVPEDGFTLRFRTSDDVTRASACLAGPADAEVDENEFDTSATADDDFPACDVQRQAFVEQRAVDYIQWVATFHDCDVPGENTGGLCSNVGTDADERELDLSILGVTTEDDPASASNAECVEDFASNNFADQDATLPDSELGVGSGQCVLDEHYVVSVGRQATEAIVTFVIDRQGTNNDNNCSNPDQEETNQLGDGEFVRGCLLDQFGNSFPFENNQGSATFESVGPEGSGIFSCPGESHDHDDDGRVDHCHVDQGDDNVSGDDISGWDIRIDNESDDGIDATPGDQTVTFCYDPEAFEGDEANPGTGSGCADETVKDDVLKHWGTAPEDIELVFNEAGTDPQDQCLTGDKFKENEVGDTDELLACTFDDEGNFASTTPADAGRLQWFIAPSGGGELTATRFTTPPPNETGNDGTTTADIESFRQGNDIITVCLQDDPGNDNVPDDTCASVQKRVTQSGGPPQCNDGQDNDGDGRIDHPADPDCTSPSDDSEAGDGPGPPVTRGACQGFNQNTSTPIPGGDGNVIVGTSGNDVLTGTNGNDIICGLGGDDTIAALGGRDLVHGNGGNDTASGRAGNDIVDGGKGNDSLKGNAGIDTLRGRGGDDTLQGGKGEDTLVGGGGDDTMRGWTQEDTLRGGGGNDVANGGRHRDVCRAESETACEA